VQIWNEKFEFSVQAARAGQLILVLFGPPVVQEYFSPGEMQTVTNTLVANRAKR